MDGGQNNLAQAPFDLIDVLLVLAKNKKWIIYFVLLSSLVALGVSFCLPDKYTGRVRILPPQPNQSSSLALIGKELGSLSGSASDMLGIKNPNDLYVSILQSRTLQDEIVKHLNLQQIYNAQTLSGARNRLHGLTNVVNGKDSIITIEVTDTDPKRAALIANAYPDELNDLLQKQSFTEASQRREFFEKQLKDAKAALSVAEIGLKNTQENTGIIQLEGQAHAIVDAVAELKGKIAAKQVQLAAIRTFATSNNPEWIQLQQEIAALQEQLENLEKKDNKRGDVLIPTDKIAASGLEYARKLRDVKYYETISELMAKQYELAKIDEARNNPRIQVLDPAVPPDVKSGPMRTKIVALSAVMAAFFAVMAVIFIEQLNLKQQDPDWARRFRLLKFYVLGKKS